MPVISMFYGIILQMFHREHNPPHFHAMYGDYKAMFNIEGELIEGFMPAKQIKLIQAWTAIHRDELSANWTLAVSGTELFRIEPLK